MHAGLPMPDSDTAKQEIVWILHGNISHLAIRRHIYNDSTATPVDKVIALHVAVFLAAIPFVLEPD